MKNKIVTIVLSIVLFIVPVLITPSNWFIPNGLRILLLIMCGYILFVTMIVRGKKLKFDKQDLCILAFGLLAILSTINSTNIGKSLVGEYNRFEGLFTIITYILIYYNAKYYFKNYKHFTTIGTIIYILICIFSIIQFFIGSRIKLSPIFNKGANGTFGNTNFMGSFVSIILPIFILGYIFRNKKIYLIGCIVGFCSMIMCIARSSWVAFIVYMLIILIYLIIKKHNLKRFFIVASTFIICFSGISLLNNSKIIFRKMNTIKSEIQKVSTDGITDKMGSGRIRIWKATIKLIYQLPILGCGVDALKDGLEKFCPVENEQFIERSGSYIDKAHNEYLQMAATMGIPALLVYLLFISKIEIFNIRRMFKFKLSAIYSIVIISYLVQAFFNISTIGVAPIFWFILGFSSRHMNCKKTQ